MRAATKEAVSTGAAPRRTEFRNAGYGLGGGLRAAPESPANTPIPQWHIAACWRALESVADQLGDPPRYRRYLRLAAARDDLPPAATLRARLGTWTNIAAELSKRKPAAKRTRADTTKESIGGGRLATQVEVSALRYIAAHPGSSGTAVKDGLGIRHASQAWALLARLEREGLLVNQRTGSKNAWALSAHGESVLRGLPRGMYV